MHEMSTMQTFVKLLETFHPIRNCNNKRRSKIIIFNLVLVSLNVELFVDLRIALAKLRIYYIQTWMPISDEKSRPYLRQKIILRTEERKFSKSQQDKMSDTEPFKMDMDGWDSPDSDFDGPKRRGNTGRLSNDDIFTTNCIFDAKLSKWDLLELDDNNFTDSKPSFPEKYFQQEIPAFHSLKYVVYPIATHLTMARTKNEKLREQILNEARPPPTVKVKTAATGSGSNIYDMPTLSNFPSTTSASTIKGAEPEKNKKGPVMWDVVQELRKKPNDKMTSTTGRQKRRPSQSPSNSLSLNDPAPANPKLGYRSSSISSSRSKRKSSLPPLPKPTSRSTSQCGNCCLRLKQTACMTQIRTACRRFHNRLDKSEKFNSAMFVLLLVLILVVIACIIVYPILLVYRKHQRGTGDGDKATEIKGPSARIMNSDKDY